MKILERAGEQEERVKGGTLLSDMNTGRYPYHFLKPGTWGGKQAF